MNNQHTELFHRHKRNPILSAANWPYPVNSIFNPAATLLPDGTTLLLCRVEDRRGHSHFTVARSDNGLDNWRIESRPTLLADPEHFPEEVWGIEDPRITYLSELGKYAVVYTAFSRDGPGVSLAQSRQTDRCTRSRTSTPPVPVAASLAERAVRWVRRRFASTAGVRCVRGGDLEDAVRRRRIKMRRYFPVVSAGSGL